MSDDLFVASVLLGDKFADLLSKLPDLYFRLNEIQKSIVWHTILHAINQGQRDPIKLAEMVKSYMSKESVR